MAWREEKKLDQWTVPYLPLDPMDSGRTCDGDVIQINSQSGKGGVAYILKHNLGFDVPDKMREEIVYAVKDVADKDKLGLTFSDIVKNVRMKKARSLLKSGNMTVEAIADSVGYQNVEHFNRLFKMK